MREGKVRKNNNKNGGDEGSAGRLWPSAQVWVSQKIEIFEWWETENSVPNRWGLGNWGILSDEWRKLSEEWWVIVF